MEVTLVKRDISISVFKTQNQLKLLVMAIESLKEENKVLKKKIKGKNFLLHEKGNQIKQLKSHLIACHVMCSLMSFHVI